ncbi:MAG: hypothetical protein ACKOPT_13555 [Cyanobium sp.]
MASQASSSCRHRWASGVWGCRSQVSATAAVGPAGRELEPDCRRRHWPAV